MIIDFHSHLAPAKWRETKPLPPSLTNIDQFFATKEAAGIDLSVISNPMMNVPGSQQNDLTIDLVREYNEFAHAIVAGHPGRVVALTGINPFGDPVMVQEMVAAVTQGGFKGVVVNSSVNGEFLDAPSTAEFWAAAAALDVPVFIHPPALPLGGARFSDFRLVEHAARPCDVALSIAAVVFAGILERYPILKLVGGMAGGGLGMLPGRLDMGYRYAHWRLGAEQRGGPPPFTPPGVTAAPDRISGLPSQYISRVYVDTCTYSAPALLCNLQVFGADHVLFGTDFPPVNTPLSEAIQLVRALPISAEAQEQIFSRNAAAILHLERPVGGASVGRGERDVS